MNKNFALLFAGLFAFSNTVFANEDEANVVPPAVETEEVEVETQGCRARAFAKKVCDTVWTNRSKLEIAGAAYVAAALIFGYKGQKFESLESNSNGYKVANAGRFVARYATSPLAAAKKAATWVAGKFKKAPDTV